MKICQQHWDKLRKAIEDRGLSSFIQTGEQNMATFEAVAEGTHTEKELPYDPLMSCNWMIWGQALKAGGLYLMQGNHCPVCEAKKHLSGHNTVHPVTKMPFITTPEWVEEQWIDGPADAALAECRARGMVKEN